MARGADRQGRRPGADVGHRGLPAAQPAAAGALRSPSIRRASSSRSRSRPAIPSSPASTIRRRPSASCAAAASTQPGVVARRSAAARIRRDCRRSSGGPTTRTTTSWSTTCSTAAKARRRGRRCARASATPILVWDTTTVPNGTYFVKVVASDAPSNAAGHRADRRARQLAFDIDNTPPAIVVGASASSAAARSSPFDVKDDHSPIQRSSSRRTASAGAACSRWTASPTRATEHYELAIDGELGERGLTLRASDSMNNVATTHVDRAARAVSAS